MKTGFRFKLEEYTKLNTQRLLSNEIAVIAEEGATSILLSMSEQQARELHMRLTETLNI